MGTCISLLNPELADLSEEIETSLKNTSHVHSIVIEESLDLSLPPQSESQSILSWKNLPANN